MTDSSPEVLIIGGGPAGASAARLLASWGHAVRVIARPAGEARLAESVPPSCAKLFDAIGVGDAIERAGFIRSTGNTVWWGSDVPRVELFAEGGRGWQIESTAFAELLLREATHAGAIVERRTYPIPDPPSTRLIRASRESPSLRAGRLPTPDSRLPTPDPPFILDCSGRTGVLARAYGLREYDDGPRTVALVASWRVDRDWNIPDATHTLVESYEGGWAWSVPTSRHARHIAVMVDPRRSDLTHGGSALDTYLAEIARTREFRSLTRGGTIEAGPWGWDASTYRSRQYAGDRWLLAGDAGSFIDPLSSAGVKKALASGWLAAIVAHTWLVRPEMRHHAMQFFGSRETDIHRQFVAMTRRMLGDAAAGHVHRFWADRWDEQPATGRRPAAEYRETADDDDAVRASFEQLRQAETFRVRRGAVVVEPRPAVSGCEIVLEDRLVDARRPAGIRFVRDVDVLALIDLAPRFSAVPDVFDAYCGRSGPVALPDFLRALATALANGWLVSE